MLNLFAAFKKDRIWDFDGGIHPPEMKTQSSGAPLRVAPLPKTFIIPLQQHLGPEGELCINAGDRVLKGQPLTVGRGRTVPVHAPTSGTVSAIAPHITAHPSGLSELCVIIEADGEDRWCEREPVADYRQSPAAELIQRIHQAGIAGLGGAGFPTASKLQGGMSGVETLILNAAECEPYITADDRLMQEHADQIVEGTQILQHILQPKVTLIGIEDNKPEAIAALKQALRRQSGIALRVVPTKYPSGGAKQLTKILTGKEVPHGKHSSAIGVLMQNVGTAFAIKRAIVDGEPLIERVVTLTGEAVERPGNLWARIGTPVQHLLDFVGFRPQAQQMVVMGGPLMGFTLPALNVPIVKISNCILAPTVDEMTPQEPEQSCIRCGLCVDACPAGLLPQQLYWFSRGQEHDKARNHNLFDCIECGACAFVCPSNIPLVQYYRQEKAEIKAIDLEAARTAEAKARYEAKLARLEREKLAREERHKKAAVKLTDDDQGAVQAALARVRSKNAEAAVTPVDGQQPDNSEMIAAREARKAQARERRAQLAAEAEQASPATSGDDARKAAVAAALARVKARKEAPAADITAHAATEDDPRKAAVAAALARVKAKKTAQQADAPAETEPAPAAAEEDPRKAAVAAALARVKAKKAAQQADAPAETEPAPATAEEDPRKAAVAAAIARAKAKKAAQQAGAPAETEPAPASAEEDPRKAAVAAAIARAKAKKAAQQADAPAETAPAPAAAEEDPRKAAVAAAIARAKAKKAARESLAAETEDK
ncbi:electron transport complex subunit RsxC [Serratia sp. OLHL2]|uniref:electron transport complex subunit RsxC n=1 Tax=unclassified Serratia (in: enterobacteria) TaxID=2647522 RepID=UPI000C1822D9|nr:MULTISPECIES: electron transport complex subunit RsxC [unclassified Serratia (in: enterobacteria)]PII52267.1 electron transport complex subunit RsxC [Serratia sp. OLEL1]PII55901.1 electron transport complex subunit RsxC [Serratia sp. OLBL1]PII62462.1 electron transport complex subunit RsxC [Serratia sp. OLCL1]PII64847.1 electron transport complex subunit RsxC [Serratia sp. OLHL2]PII71705.1 electron transport complex subunit RsxC [Serratia sp. OLIL2]